MYILEIGGGNCYWGTVVSQEQRACNHRHALLTPYLAPALTFLLLWESRGVSGGCVRWVSMEFVVWPCAVCWSMISWKWGGGMVLMVFVHRG